MEKNRMLNEGTEVYIFSNLNSLDVEKAKKGIIKSMFIPTALIMHGDPGAYIIYKVVGEDEKIYCGCYGCPNVKENFFLTEEDYFDYLESKAAMNNAKINEMIRENEKMEAFMKENGKTKKRR